MSSASMCKSSLLASCCAPWSHRVGARRAAGGINFDAKLRRESTDVMDLFYGHISGMDALARGLRNAARLLEVGPLPRV